ncbi:unnamed protein product [Brassica napus]|uniref:(rape) hypothetical protein n=1 Tax=Brassica napus TaxID=3708 RepID=A0A817B6Q5_BRANA|nr:unnamed protein product [Brassica napus]
MEQDKGRPLPKFGEWDVNDPASAEGFTVIFNKARDEKKTGGKPGSPGKSTEGHAKSGGGGGDPSKPQPDDVDVYFRIKRNVELREMMEAFSHKVGKQMSALVFLFDGIRIKPNQTPKELDLEEGDEIDALDHQTGGLSFCAIPELS